MSLFRPDHPIPHASMHADLKYTPLASSLFICLSLALILSGLVFVRSITLRHRRNSLISTPTPDYSSRIMSSEAYDPSLPLPSTDAKAIDLLPSNPLAGTYFPFTSGQLAALADKRATEGNAASASDETPSAADLNAMKPGDPDVIAQGYVRYFEDRQNGEAWQRKALVYNGGNQRIT